MQRLPVIILQSHLITFFEKILLLGYFYLLICVSAFLE